MLQLTIFGTLTLVAAASMYAVVRPTKGDMPMDEHTRALVCSICGGNHGNASCLGIPAATRKHGC